MRSIERTHGKQPSGELSTSESVVSQAHWIVRSLLAVLFLVPVTVGQSSFTTDSTTPKNVLVLFSFSDRSYNAALDLFKTTVRSNVQAPVNFYIEYLESQRFGNADYEESLSKTLQHAYAGQKLDVVAAYAYPAFLFALKHREQLFPGASIVFSGVDPRVIDSQNPGPGVTGITFSEDVRGTLDLALRLHPDTKNVAVVTGISDFETYRLKALHEEFRPYQNKVKLIDVVGVPSNHLLAQVYALPPETIVLFDLTPREAEQPLLARNDILALVSQRFPTYCMHTVTFCLGSGAVGGSFADVHEQQVKAGELVARILSGENPENIPVIRDSGERPYLDWHQLQRWNIPDSAVPPGSVVLYREPGAWERYKRTIIGALAFIAVQALLILVLFSRRKRAEQALRESEERLRLMSDNLPNSMLYQCTRNGDGTPQFIYVSAGAERLNGVKAEDVLKEPGTLYRLVLPEELPELLAAERVSARDCSVFDREVRLRLPNGELRWMHFRSRPRRLPNGRTIWDGVETDITERKLAEQALIRSEKLASAGRMAATIAHEINNPLEAVTNALFIAKENEGLPTPVRQYLDIADEELKRITHLTRQSLGFYRESNSPTPTSLIAVLDSAVDLLKSKIKAKHVVTKKQWDGDVQIVAVAGELRQLFSNLLSNSLDATDEKGRITLRVSTVATFEQGQRHVRVTIADNGKGISANLLSHIFEPFFTTKGTVGTGLGLWVSKQIVDKHGGTIRVRSNTDGPRRGTTFSALLPTEPTTHSQSSAACADAVSERVVARGANDPGAGRRRSG